MLLSRDAACNAFVMPFLWAAWIYVPWRRGLSSLGEAASLKSSLLFSSESLIRALFLKWSPWPQSSFRCLISPTLHIPCCALKVYHLLRVSRISGIIRRHCYQLFCCFGRRSLHIQPDWFHSLLFSWVSFLWLCSKWWQLQRGTLVWRSILQW